MEKKLFVLEQKLGREAIKRNNKTPVENKKDSVLGAIKKYKEEDKEKSSEAKKPGKQNER